MSELQKCKTALVRFGVLRVRHRTNIYPDTVPLKKGLTILHRGFLPSAQPVTEVRPLQKSPQNSDLRCTADIHALCTGKKTDIIFKLLTLLHMDGEATDPMLKRRRNDMSELEERLTEIQLLWHCHSAGVVAFLVRGTD